MAILYIVVQIWRILYETTCSPLVRAQTKKGKLKLKLGLPKNQLLT